MTHIQRFYYMFIIIVSFCLCSALTYAGNFSARVINHDLIELYWSDDEKQSSSVLGYSIERAFAESPADLNGKSLDFKPVIDLQPDVRFYRIQIKPETDPPVTIFHLRAREKVGDREMGLSSLFIIRKPDLIIPLPFEPSEPTVAGALGDIWRRGLKLYRYYDETPLSGDDPARAGMVFYVKKPLLREIVLAGAITHELTFQFPAGKVTGFCFPFLADSVPYERLLSQAQQLEGMTVYLDTNMLPLLAKHSLGCGWHVYAFRSDRSFVLTLPGAHLSIDFTTFKPRVFLPERTDASRPQGRDTNVRILYDSSYETARYKCWENGYSGPWDGITDHYSGVDEVINAAVVRRDRSIYVTDVGITSSTPVTIWGPAPPGATRQFHSFSVGWSEEKQAATIVIPDDAPIGDYRLQVGPDQQNFCTMYVIFDAFPFSMSHGGPFNQTEMASWVYTDISYTGTNRDGYGSEFDYLNYQYWGPVHGPGSTELYGYRGATDAELGRDGGLYGQRTVELFSSIHGWGAVTPLEAAIHCYEIIGQRITWTMKPYYGSTGSYYNYHDRIFAGEQIVNYMGGTHTATELDVNTAEKAALGFGFSDRFPPTHVYDCGQCMNFGALMSHSLRSIGIPATMHYAARGAGWLWSFHVWANAAFLDADSTPVSWGGIWYKFDPCDIYDGSSTAHLEGHIGPVVFDGFGDYLLNTFEYRDGPGYRGCYELNEAAWGNSYSTHADSILKANTFADPHGSDLLLNVDQTTCPFGVYDSFADASGTDQSSYVYVIPGHHGYALNDTQWRHNGLADDPTLNDNENLPLIGPGDTINGVIGGWGTAWYRLKTHNQDQIEVTVLQGEEHIKLYGRWDQPVTSTQSRHSGLLYDMGPTTSISCAPISDQLFIMVQGEDDAGTPLDSQQLVFFSLHRTDFNEVPTLTPLSMIIILILMGNCVIRRSKR